jgi:hypothetical protein
MTQRLAVARDRKDHYVPQGYLRGFIHPERLQHPKPLRVLDAERGVWSERSPSQIAWKHGYYDYSEGAEPDATADEAFLFIENRFPLVREQIRTSGYETWIEHRAFLVSCAAMLAARSPLFRTCAVSQVSPLLPASLVKNYSITLMRTELQHRPDTWQAYHWVLGYTKNPEQPFVTGDQPVGMWGNSLGQAAASENRDYWVWCPLSWDMCLIGSSLPLNARSTSELLPEQVAEVQKLTRTQSSIFLASPVVLPHLTATSAPA